MTEENIEICLHTCVDYIGVQHNELDKPAYYLVNCLDCKTTVVYHKEIMLMKKGLDDYILDYKKYGDL